VPTLLDVLGVTADDVPEDIRLLLWDLNGKKGQPGENWAKREVVGKHNAPAKSIYTQGSVSLSQDVDITAPATDAAREWQGWGTALKPAHEPIVLARKPLTGTVAANVQQHGTGALNIDGARVGDGQITINTFDNGAKPFGGAMGEPYTSRQSVGRWPANVITDGSIEAEWVRYFYAAKPSKRERNAGLEALNHHPTVKPLALMRYLVRLVTPPGGTVLEPFAGSGTTLAAAILEGFDAIGCELTDDYLPIIEGRVAWAQQERAKANDSLFGDVA
jgi:site-specific DNA-methyltransferase (adenine-specific)